LRLRSGFLASLSVLLLDGCLYGFAGGGLPSNIKTVAVLPFDNQTPEPTLTQEINTAVREAFEGRLGLRQASERQADAVVRGTITRYEPDIPVAFNGDDQGGEVNVTRRVVQISVSVEILDQHNNKPLWQRSGLMVEGDYEPGQESEAQAREKALDKLVTNIVEGAQSQW
jgi:Lipopolysaccharide-assembly